MVFEKSIPLKAPKMLMCHGFTTMLNKLVKTADSQLQAIVNTDDLDSVMDTTKTICDLINEYLQKILDHYSEDEQMNLRCDILK